MNQIQSKPRSAFETYVTRDGTTDCGRLYEAKVAALLCLRCAGKETEDMWMASNANEVSDFDDVVFCKKTLDGRFVAYMMQLKHKDSPKIISSTDFEKKKDFSLSKHSESVNKLKNKIDNPTENEPAIIKYLRATHEMLFIFYTNKIVNDCKPDFLKCDSNNKLQILTTTTDRGFYSFDWRMLEDFNREFIQRLYLLSNQANVGSIDNFIKDEIKQLISPVTLTDKEMHKISDKFLTFVMRWAQSNTTKKQYFLTKQDVVDKLSCLLLNRYKVNLSMRTLNLHDSPQKQIFNDIVSDKLITVVDWNNNISEFVIQYISSEVAKLCAAPEKYHWDSNLPPQLKQMLHENYDRLTKRIAKCCGNPKNYTFLDIYTCMWLDNRLPLLLEIKTLEDYENVRCILQLSNFALRVILLNKTSKPLPKMDDIQNHFETFEDLESNHRETILNQQVKLQGRSISLRDLLIDESMFRYMTSNDVIRVLTNDFNIGHVYEAPSCCFIERNFYRILINLEVLKDINNELFLIEKPSQLECIDLHIDESRICNLDYLDKADFNKTNVIIAKTHGQLEEVQETIYKSSGKPIHWLKFDGVHHMEWKKSFGSTNNIKLYQFHNKKEDDQQLTYTIKEICEQQHSTNILSASPGMGKSTLMNCLAHRIPTSMWILNINLNQHKMYYKREEERENSETEASTHLKYFNNEILENGNCNTKLTEMIFQKFLENKRILTILDGFDEISIFHKTVVTNIAKCLHREGYQMWLTTRPIMKSHLEEEFNSISLTLKPFTVDDQKTFLVKYFTENHADTVLDVNSHYTVAKFVEELLAAAAFNLNDFDYEFTGIPLQTKLLADAFSDECLKLLKTNSIKFNKHFDLVDLYENFIKTKRYKMKDMLLNHKKYQSYCALRILFDEELLQKLNIEEELDKYKEVNDEGIQLLQSDGVMVGENEFVHRTFAEYIAAKWLDENVYSKDDKIRYTVQMLLNERFDHYYKFLFNIFDRLVSKNCPTHLAVINGRLDEAYNKLYSSPNKMILEDKLGTSLLHIVAIYGNYNPYQTFYEYLINLNKDTKNIVELLLSDKETNFKEYKLGYSPLDYAIANGSLAIANKICANINDLNINVQISLDVKEKYFLYCATMDYSHLFETILKYFVYVDLVTESDLEQHTLLYTYCIEGTKQLASDKDFIIRKLQEFLNKLDVLTISDLFQCQPPHIKPSSTFYYSNLHLAAAYRSIHNVNYFLSKGFEIDKEDIFLNTPLHYAVLFERLEMVYLLAQRGANVNIPNEDGFTPLYLAVQKANLDIVTILLDSGAEVNITHQNNDTPLELAMQMNLPNIKALLMQRNSVSNIKPYEDKPDRIYVEDKVIDFLIDINCDPVESEFRLRAAITEEDLSEIQKLIFSGVDINKQNYSGNTPLHWAVKYGNEEIVRCLLLNNADVNILNNDGNTALHCAVIENDDECIALFFADDVIAETENTNNVMSLYSQITTLRHKIYINQQNSYGETALTTAVLNDNLNITKLLLSNGADINILNGNDLSGLHIAASNGYSGIVAMLLEQGANINVQNDSHYTPLYHAIEYGYVDIVKMLLSKGADINITDIEGNSYLHLAARIGSDEEIISLLLAAGAEINKPTHGRDLTTPLHIAIEKNQMDIVKLLLSHGAEITIEDFQKNTALHYAALDNFQEVLLLLSKNVSINVQNDVGDTPLHIAVDRCNEFVTEQLISHGANINIRNFRGNTTLHTAVLRYSEDIISLLLSKGAEVNSKNSCGRTPLYLAVEQNFIRTTRLLLDNGADVNTDCFKNTVLHEAAVNGFQEIVSLLLVAGAKPDPQNYHKCTPLHYALKRGNACISKLLVVNGANTNITDSLGNTALHTASARGYIDIVSLLLSAGAEINKRNDRGYTSLYYAILIGHVNTANLLLRKRAEAETKIISEGIDLFLFLGLYMLKHCSIVKF